MMHIRVGCEFRYEATWPTPTVIQVQPHPDGLCCKNSQRNPLGKRSLFLLGLGRHSEQVGDEGDLPSDFACGHPEHLAFANHVHRFVALERSPSRLKGKEAQALV